MKELHTNVTMNKLHMKSFISMASFHIFIHVLFPFDFVITMITKIVIAAIIKLNRNSN